MKWPVFKNQSDIPEAFRPLYEEVDGQWKPKAPEDDGDGDNDDGDGDKAAAALQTALEKERKLRADAEKAAKDAQTAAKAAEQALKEAERLAAGKAAGKTEDELKALTEKIRNDLRSEVADEVAALQGLADQVKPLQEKLQLVLLDSKVKARMLKKGVVPERVDKLFSLEREKFGLTEDEKPMVAAHPGKSLDVFIEDDLKKEYPEWFVGTQASGGGAGGHMHNLPRQATGTTAEDVLKDPVGAIAAARAAEAGAK